MTCWGRLLSSIKLLPWWPHRKIHHTCAHIRRCEQKHCTARKLEAINLVLQVWIFLSTSSSRKWQPNPLPTAGVSSRDHGLRAASEDLQDLLEHRHAMAVLFFLRLPSCERSPGLQCFVPCMPHDFCTKDCNSSRSCVGVVRDRDSTEQPGWNLTSGTKSFQRRGAQRPSRRPGS